MYDRLRHASLTLLLLAAMLAAAPLHLSAQEPVASSDAGVSSISQLEVWDSFLAILDSIWSSIASPPPLPPAPETEPATEEPEYDVGIDPSG